MTAFSACASRSTGKERDTESGNDYFEARYYSSAMGRFMSPDWDESPVTIPYANLSNPQTLNLYAYLSNNPLNRTDPTGHAGKSGPIQLGGQTTMRVDTGGADQVNVHVFSKNGEFRGRLNPEDRMDKGHSSKGDCRGCSGVLSVQGKVRHCGGKARNVSSWRRQGD
jgi:RHS repeat-associated protein